MNKYFEEKNKHVYKQHNVITYRMLEIIKFHLLCHSIILNFNITMKNCDTEEFIKSMLNYVEGNVEYFMT